eukprot:TRINITY_DN18301_c0_g1_i1.p1 TRINITY_DN18301_c0_g1~~TRINITY_DN18301_c0_g1_i1.p1  ORF type:complete len:925 (-),score=139.24 TRINITY_DN18301_c0_g1_i1:15-2789(-)
MNTEDNIDRLKNLKIWTKFGLGEIYTITQKDVEDLFDVLDQDGSGSITGEELLALQLVDGLNLSVGDLNKIIDDADRDKSGSITASELYKAMTTGQLAFNYVREALGKKLEEVEPGECTRDELLDWLKTEYETSTALWALPLTAAIFMCFCFVCTQHIDLFNSFYVHHAWHGFQPELWEGSKYKQIDMKNIVDWTTRQNWGWIRKLYRQDPIYDPVPGRVIYHNQMIIGSRIQKTMYETGDCYSSEAYGKLFDTQTGKCHAYGEPQIRVEVFPYHIQQAIMLELLTNMSDFGWFDQSTYKVEFHTLTLNAPVNLFSLHVDQYNIEWAGVVRYRQQSESWLAEPYLHGWWCIPDVLYLLLLFRMLYLEMKELIPAMYMGLDGVADYLGFWNAVDWITILFGMSCMAYWAYFVQQVTGPFMDAIEDIPKKILDDAIAAKGGYLTLPEFAKIISFEEFDSKTNRMYNVAMDIRSDHQNVRHLFVINLFVLMGKFFKSFRANPRLDIVIATLANCSMNFVHFFIVFMALFVCFAAAGFFLLGPQMFGFRMFTASLYSCWRSGVGFDTLEDMRIGVQQVAYCWTLLYQILVQILTLNMLIGIVFDSYAVVKAAAGEPDTLWRQVRIALKRARETRTHVSLYELIVQMEDDDYPAHPAQNVTPTTLRKAFEKEKMSRQNAQYLVQRVTETKKAAQEEIPFTFSDAIKLVGQVKLINMKLVDTLESIMDYLKKKGDLNENDVLEVKAVNPSATAEAEDDAETILNTVETGLENIASILDTFGWEHRRSAKSLKVWIQNEYAACVKRNSGLQNQVQELESRMGRASRCIARLEQTLDGVTFGQLEGIPERMEQDMMLSFGSKLSLAKEGISQSQLRAFEQKLREVVDQTQELSARAEQNTQAAEICWNIEQNLRALGKPHAVKALANQAHPT